MLLQSCCCSCTNAVTATPPTTDRCRNALPNTSIGELVWLQGLDDNLCERFQRLADAVGLRDCAGNRVALETPVVLCSDFAAQLCAAIAGLASGGEAVPGVTELVGADCLTYTIPSAGTPSAETPNAVVDTQTIDFTATGTLLRTISGSVNVSPDAGNVLIAHVNGLFVPTQPASTPACDQLQAFATGGDVIAGTVLIGADCLKHTFPAPAPLTVADTSSVNLTLVGLTLQADVKLDPSSIGRVTGSGVQVTCADVLVCAPPVTVADSTSVDLTLIGQGLVAAVIVDPDPVNALAIRPAGLFVDVCTAINAGAAPVPAVVASTVLVGADCDRYTLPPQVPVTAFDTATADVTINGGTQVRVDVKLEPATLLTIGASGLQVTCEAAQDCIFATTNNFWSYNDLGNSVAFNPSADAGNLITTGTDGRPLVTVAPMTVTDTSCINLTFAANALSAVPIISAQPDNGLLCLPDGLFSALTDVDVTGIATNCFAVGVAESVPNQFEVSVTPIISGTAGNIITCTVSGLYASGGIVAVADTNCINMSVAEAPIGTFTVSAVPILANTYPGFPAGCNSLQCTASGLAAPPEHTAGMDVGAVGASSAAPMVALDTFVSSTLFTFTNTDTCRSVQIQANYIWPTMSTNLQTTPMTLRDNMDIASSMTGVLPNRNIDDDLSVESATAAFSITRGRASLIDQGLTPLAPGATITVTVTHTFTMLRGDAGAVNIDGAEVSFSWQTL